MHIGILSTTKKKITINWELHWSTKMLTCGGEVVKLMRQQPFLGFGAFTGLFVILIFLLIFCYLFLRQFFAVFPFEEGSHTVAPGWPTTHCLTQTNLGLLETLLP